jgi:hypothetical protein
MREPWNDPVRLDLHAGRALVDEARLSPESPMLAKLRARDSELLLARAATIRTQHGTKFQPPEKCK